MHSILNPIPKLFLLLMITGKKHVCNSLTACLRLLSGMNGNKHCLQQEIVLVKNHSIIFLMVNSFYLQVK